MNDTRVPMGTLPEAQDSSQERRRNGAGDSSIQTSSWRMDYAVSLPATHLLALQVEVKQQFVGETQSGYRVDLYYSGENSPLEIPRSSGLPDSPRKLLEKAIVLSGNDWVTVNSEAVLDFDSRITLAVPLSKRVRCLVGGRLRGRAQLRYVLKQDGSPLFEAKDTDAVVIDRWRQGFGEGSYLPLLLSASFDVPQRGFDDRQDVIYEELRTLARYLFIGCGEATFAQAAYGAVRTIRLDLYKVEPLPSPNRPEKGAHSAV